MTNSNFLACPKNKFQGMCISDLDPNYPPWPGFEPWPNQ